MSDRLRPLDGVRGIAALIIACFLHWHDNINPHFVLLRFWNGYLDGRILVEFFFLISGLTFTAFYMKRIANSEVSFSDFIYSRFVRLAPLYYGTLFYVTFMLILRKIFSVGTFTYQYNDVHHFVLNLLMIQNYGLQTDANFNAISWTVCIEVLMYIVFFVICKMTKTKHTYFAICWGLIIVGYTLEKSDWKGSTFTLVNANIGRGMIAFFVNAPYQVPYKLKAASAALLYCFFGFLTTSGNFSDHGSRSSKNDRSLSSMCLEISVRRCSKYSYGFRLFAFAVSAML